jgi:hypothetical protein
VSLLLWSIWKQPEKQLAGTLRIPKFAALFLTLFFLMRCAYFVLAPLGTLQTTPQGFRIFLAECVIILHRASCPLKVMLTPVTRMPTFLFFTTCTLMISWWYEEIQ